MRLSLHPPRRLSAFLLSAGHILHWLALAWIYGFMACKSFLQFSRPADLLAFHLPRALGYFGLTTYEYGEWAVEEAKGYPDFAHVVMGSLVWISGRISAANAVNAVGFFTAVLCIGLLYRKEFAMRWFLTFCLAFPVFFYHITAGFIDLFTASMILLGFAGMYGLSTRHKPLASAVLMVLGLTAAMASKMTAWVPVTVFALWGAYMLCERRALIGKPAQYALLALLAAGIGLYPLKNYYLYGSPTYPIHTKIVMFTLPNLEVTSPVEKPNFPPYMERMSNPMKFFSSLMEQNRTYRRIPYSWSAFENHGRTFERDQAGGFFWLAVVIVSLVLIASYVLNFMNRNMLGVFCASVFLVSMMPYGAVLRYSLFIPLVALFLICANLGTLPKKLRLAFLTLMTGASCFVTMQINRNFWTLDTRLAQDYVNMAARSFWAAREKEPTTAPLTIEGTYPATIYWSGPTFNQYPVREKLENNLKDVRIEVVR